jgi:hypothetical protein
VAFGNEMSDTDICTFTLNKYVVNNIIFVIQELEIWLQNQQLKLDLTSVKF